MDGQALVVREWPLLVRILTYDVKEDGKRDEEVGICGCHHQKKYRNGDGLQHTIFRVKVGFSVEATKINWHWSWSCERQSTED
jgi:hypothetical protein